MTTWRLDIDEAAIYCGDTRVAALVSDCSNDGWREACRVGQDIVDAMERRGREVEVLRAERDHARACMQNAVKILTGIHALMYPAPVTAPDGRTMVFRPKGLDLHEVLQELSDRIRAIPDEIAAQANPPKP